MAPTVPLPAAERATAPRRRGRNTASAGSRDTPPPDAGAPAVAAAPTVGQGWRCRWPAGLHTLAWQGDAAGVLFDEASGRTHRLDMPTLLVLRQIERQGTATTEVLAAAHTPAATLAHTLDQLQALQLIEPCSPR